MGKLGHGLLVCRAGEETCVRDLCFMLCHHVYYTVLEQLELVVLF